MKKLNWLCLFLVGLLSSSGISRPINPPQERATQQPPSQSYLPPAANSATPNATGTPASPIPTQDYILGPFDQIAVIVGELRDEFGDTTFRIDGNGDVSLPVAGRLHAGGLTLHAFEEVVKDHLSPVLKHPDVVVNVTEFSSQSVSVLGAVGNPGVRKLVGKCNLFDALSLSGGLAENAGTTVKITREARWGKIPWPNTIVDPVTHLSTAIVRIKDIATAGADSFTVMPGDTVFVPNADIIYAVGSVNKPGGFTLDQSETLSALQIVSLAGGLAKTAAGDKAKILRTVPGTTNRTEIEVNIKRLLAGKVGDVQLRPQDILFIPNSDAKSVGYRTIDAIVNAATGVAIYGSRM